jgi:hypothetical protein
MLAIFWHLYLGAFVIGLVLGWRPSKRIYGILLSIPLFSVSGLAWSSMNPFNGALFAIVGLILLVLALRMPDEQIQVGPTWAVAAGMFMFLFGWVYPHFLDTTSFITYLYAAPTGLIPCPTLSILIGFGLLVEGLDSRPWSLVLGGTGIFYALFGALRLGVAIDLVLLVGALLLILVALIGKAEVQRSALAH